MRFYNYLNEKTGWDKLPKGWTKKSVEKFVKSLVGKDPEDKSDEFFTKCYKKMKDEDGFDEKGAKKFCASLKDEFYGTTEWRGKGKKDKEWRDKE